MSEWMNDTFEVLMQLIEDYRMVPIIDKENDDATVGLCIIPDDKKEQSKIISDLNDHNIAYRISQIMYYFDLNYCSILKDKNNKKYKLKYYSEVNNCKNKRKVIVGIIIFCINNKT